MKKLLFAWILAHSLHAVAFEAPISIRCMAVGQAYNGTLIAPSSADCTAKMYKNDGVVTCQGTVGLTVKETGAVYSLSYQPDMRFYTDSKVVAAFPKEGFQAFQSQRFIFYMADQQTGYPFELSLYSSADGKTLDRGGFNLEAKSDSPVCHFKAH